MEGICPKTLPLWKFQWSFLCFLKILTFENIPLTTPRNFLSLPWGGKSMDIFWYHTFTGCFVQCTVLQSGVISTCSLDSSQKQDCTMSRKSVCVGGYVFILTSLNFTNRSAVFFTKICWKNLAFLRCLLCMNKCEQWKGKEQRTEV